MLLFNFFSLYDDLGVFMVEISVVIPAYNAVAYLDEAINSIINQSFTDLEIICVDDGSTDNTLDVLQSYASKDDRIQVYHQENQGHDGAIDTGISKAKGKYIYLMDADDILDLNALEELYDIMEEKDLDFVIFKAISYYQDTGEYVEENYYTMSRLHECVGDSVFYWKDIGDVIFSICVTPWSKLYRADLIKKCRKDYSGGLIYHDNILFFKMLFNSKRAYFNDKFLFTHRIYSSSTVHAHNERSVDIIRTYNLIVKTFMDYGHFEEFKEGLYNRKVSACNYRYDLINDEFKEFFFSEMKKDFEKIIGNEKYDEFYSSLYSFNRKFFDNVIKSSNHIEYDLRNELHDLTNESEKLKNEVNSLNNQVKNLKRKNKGLQKKNKSLSKFKKSVLSSKSWKITKPFRALLNYLRKL